MVKGLEATVTLEYDDERTAAAIAGAISPDNFKVPPGLLIETVREGCRVTTEIVAEAKMLTLISTIDDLLFSVSVAEKILQSAKES